MTIRDLHKYAQAPDTATAIEQRKKMREICDLAVKERCELWPLLTVDNAQEAIDWQNARISALVKERMS